jgi:hypothetical protein
MTTRNVKTARRRQPQVAGLHLWEVKIGGGDYILWFTTRTRSLRLLMKKAEKFIEQNFKGDEIKSISHEGTIDA